MKLRNIVLGLATLAAVVPAHSAKPVITKDDWQIQNVGNCKALVHVDAFFLMPEHYGSEEEVVSFTWNGACDKEGLITGPGRLTTETRDPSSGDRRRFEYRGKAKSGIMSGMVYVWRYVAVGGRLPFRIAPGSVDARGNTIYYYDYIGGCGTSGCKAEEGVALLKAYRSSRAGAAKR